MSVRVIVDFHLKPECVDTMRSILRDALPDTRGFDGCESLSFLHSQDDPNLFVALEQWATRESYEAYFKWRSETGVIAAITDMCTQPLEPRYYDFVGV